MTRTRTSLRSVTRIAIVGLAVIAVAGCSSDSKKSDADSAKKFKPAASVTKRPASTTTAPAASSTTAAATAPCTTTAAQAVLSPDTVDSIVCNGPFAAGDANNTHVDYAYLLQDMNGTWQKASDAVQEQVCTSNPQGLPASFVAAACDD